MVPRTIFLKLRILDDTESAGHNSFFRLYLKEMKALEKVYFIPYEIRNDM